jgi:hypothetical protein
MECPPKADTFEALGFSCLLGTWQIQRVSALLRCRKMRLKECGGLLSSLSLLSMFTACFMPGEFQFEIAGKDVDPGLLIDGAKELLVQGRSCLLHTHDDVDNVASFEDERPMIYF